LCLYHFQEDASQKRIKVLGIHLEAADAADLGDTAAEKFLNDNAAQSAVPDARLRISDVEIFDWFGLYPIVFRFVIKMLIALLKYANEDYGVKVVGVLVEV
jgi:hypothetical protein